MALDNDDKQHKASARRTVELRRQGNVMRSRDLTGFVVFAFGIGYTLSIVSEWKDRFINNFHQSWHSMKTLVGNDDRFFSFIKTMTIDNFKLILPTFLLILVVLLLSPFLLGGWNFTMEVIQFNLGKLNPIKNLSNMFSPSKIIFEITKSALKALFLFGMLTIFSINNKSVLFSLINYTPNEAINISYGLVVNFIILIAFSIGVLSVVDVIHTIFQYQKQSKMSTQELKDEQKETEGSSSVKGKIRSAQMKLAKQRLSITVPKSTVIITNPTHYSIALQYHDKKDRAPKVVAKGKDVIAQQIKMIAVANAIPIYEAPSLARALYHTTKLGQEIHPDLYMAVAIILSYVHQLKNYQMGIGQQPKYVRDFSLPKEFIYNE